LNLFFLEIIGFSLYSGILAYVWLALSKSRPINPNLSVIIFITILLHGYVAYLNIDGKNGHDFGLFNIFNMTTWLAMILVFWNLVKYKSYALLTVSLPIAALSLLEVAVFNGVSPIQLDGKFVDILHILLGICAMSFLLLAALQAILVLIMDHQLRRKSSALFTWLGPLQSLERYLIQLLSSGFLLLTISLALVIFLPSEAKQQQYLHKIILTILSWGVLGIILFGHYKRGWRGVFAAKWTLFAVFLLLLGYFGSKLAIEYIL